ncbi:MAG: ABC-2 transporter permease [Oscillospiraceae bacterium]
MGAIFKRELRSYFYSPLGYVFLIVMWIASGYFFTYMLANSVSYIEYVFQSLLSIVMIIIPILTMRLMSEDKKLKTDQLLFTSPVNTSGVVWGKYFAALLMFLIGIATTLIFIIILATFTTPNWNIFLGNFVGLAVLGGALISIGLFISSLTENQMIAAIVSFAVMLFISMFDVIAQMIPTSLSFLATIMKELSFTSRYNDFVSGILNISHIVFFISIIVVFNFLTVRLLERKRWN